MKVIYLDPDESITAIGDRLARADGGRVALVLSEGDGVLREPLDLRRLRRKAEDLQLEVGLVTAEPEIRAEARALRLPVFTTVAASQRQRWRPTILDFRFRILDGDLSESKIQNPKSKISLDLGDRREMARRLTPRPTWQRWLWRYVEIFVFFLTLATVVVGFLYAIPSATVTIYPTVEAIRVTRQIVADPQLEAVNFSGASVPARQLVVVRPWQASVETTGTRDVPEAPARGTVVFVNRLPQPVSVPAGTRVRTSAGTSVVFQTIEGVEVAGSVGAAAEAEVVAVETGLRGNVAANLINRIDGSLALQLTVRNLEAMAGGAVRPVMAVTAADHERLRAHVLEQLLAVATSDMEAGLAPGEFLAHDSVRVVEVYHETFSHFPGEQADRLVLEIQAETRGTAVDAGQAVALAHEAVAQAVAPGFVLVPESLTYHSGEVLGVDGQGRVTFAIIGEGVMAAQFDLNPSLRTVAGRPVHEAVTFLQEYLPLRRPPAVEVRPGWFGRLPYLPARIQTQIET